MTDEEARNLRNSLRGQKMMFTNTTDDRVVIACSQCGCVDEPATNFFLDNLEETENSGVKIKVTNNTSKARGTDKDGQNACEDQTHSKVKKRQRPVGGEDKQQPNKKERRWFDQDSNTILSEEILCEKCTDEGPPDLGEECYPMTAGKARSRQYCQYGNLIHDTYDDNSVVVACSSCGIIDEHATKSFSQELVNIYQ